MEKEQERNELISKTFNSLTPSFLTLSFFFYINTVLCCTYMPANFSMQGRDDGPFTQNVFIRMKSI